VRHAKCDFPGAFALTHEHERSRTFSFLHIDISSSPASDKNRGALRKNHNLMAPRLRHSGGVLRPPWLCYTPARAGDENRADGAARRDKKGIRCCERHSL
jgi:hypothetical protein